MPTAPPRRTQVAIVGAGPAGLTLAHLLHLQGIESVVLEARSREHVEQRIRAGMLEPAVAGLYRDTGLGARLDRRAETHEAIALRFARRTHRFDLVGLTGRAITLYGQQLLVQDLVRARADAGLPLHFDARVVRIEGLEDPGARPRVTARIGGRPHVVEADVVAGCDGRHGASRARLPARAATVRSKTLPSSWLGILSDNPPSSEEVVYAHHPDGFAMHSRRGRTRTRQYLQVPVGTDPADWPAERIWAELRRRLDDEDGFELTEGPILETLLARLRGEVVEPPRYGRLFLAGDAAHVVPPAGGKGLNLAVADVCVLARLIAGFYATGDERVLDDYSPLALARAWRVQQFSWQLTSLLHAMPGHREADRRLQLAALETLVTDRPAAVALATQYVGLPLPPWSWSGD